ncbi:9995_t:CDS:2, partial [Gigaspora margarita]
INIMVLDVQFSPDPITKPGKDVTTFTVNSTSQGPHMVMFFQSNKDFSTQFRIATPFSTRQNHTLKFNLWDMDEHIGCV